MVYVDARGNKTERMKNHDQKKHGSHFIKYRKTLRFSGEKKKNKKKVLSSSTSAPSPWDKIIFKNNSEK